MPCSAIASARVHSGACGPCILTALGALRVGKNVVQTGAALRQEVLFRFGAPDATRMCVTEAAIDAMSLAAIEGMWEGTLYLSTGGGWSPTTEAALRELLSRQNAQLIAATDANPQGDTFADRLRGLADEIGSDWLRLRPPADDWNEVLQERRREKTRLKAGRGVPHRARPRQRRSDDRAICGLCRSTIDNWYLSMVRAQLRICNHDGSKRRYRF